MRRLDRRNPWGTGFHNSMNIRLNFSLAALALTTALCAPAVAQYYPPPPPGYYGEQRAPRVYDERGNRIYENGRRYSDAEEGLPPPGFAVPPGQGGPYVSGHQLDVQPA